MKKSHLLFFIFSIYPLLDFYVTNSHDFFFRTNIFFIVSIAYLIIVLCIFTIFVKLKLNLNSLFLGLFVFFNYYTFQINIINIKQITSNNYIINLISQIPYFYFFFLYLLIFFIVYIFSIKIKKNNVAIFLIIFVYSTVFIKVYNEVGNLNFKKINEENITNNVSGLKRPEFKPNIFYILPDYFIGSPYLQETYNYDSSLQNNLETKNFTVIHNSFSNSSSTIFSLYHLFKSEYYMDDKEIYDSSLKHEINNLWTNTKFYNYLKKNNYKFQIISSINQFCDYPHDNCISSSNQYFEFSVSFLRKTPIIYILDKLIQFRILPPIFDTKHTILNFIDNFDNYTKYETSFYFIHTLMAYGRPMRDKNCLVIENRINLNQDIRLKYLENYKCVEKTIISLVDKIFNKFGDNVIIFVQSDHGTFFSNQGKVDITNLSKQDFKESLQNFSSYYIPKRCRNKILVSTLSQVNVFDLIYSCITNKKLKFEDDRYFWAFSNSKKIYEINDLN